MEKEEKEKVERILRKGQTDERGKVEKTEWIGNCLTTTRELKSNLIVYQLKEKYWKRK